VVMWFSRHREFKADAGAATLAGSNSMIAALQGLQRLYGRGADAEQHASLSTMKISGKQGRFGGLFSSHPPLEERIARLQRA